MMKLNKVVFLLSLILSFVSITSWAKNVPATTPAQANSAPVVNNPGAADQLAKLMSSFQLHAS